MIELIPDALLPFFHETNFTSRIEISRQSNRVTLNRLNAPPLEIEEDVRTTFEMLCFVNYDDLGQPNRDEAMLKAFCWNWVQGHRTVEATVGSQPYRLTAVEGVVSNTQRRQESLTVTGYAVLGDYRSSDLARLLIASLPPPPVKVGPRSIVSLKQRGLEL